VEARRTVSGNILRTLYRGLRKVSQAYYTAIVRYRCGGCGERLKVNGRSTVTRTTFLGRNVSFNGMVIGGGGKVTIGDNFHSGIECMIITQNHNYEGEAIPYDGSYVFKDVTIGDNVWIGHRVIILGGATIGEGAIIQAGSVVVGDIPKYAIAGGHPCRAFGQRDVAHYERLKAEGRFH
jgi:chloramphenicol O-acetyltransferase type B